MLRKLTAAGIVLGILGLTLFAAGPADAALLNPVAAVHQASGTPDFTPSSNGVKKYMLNVLGKVLGKAMPSSWQAEQIANEYQYNHSWEQIGVAVNGTPKFDPRADIPDSYNDTVIAGLEQQFGTTTGNTKYAIPAVKTAKLTKTVAGVGTVIGGLSVGLAIGNGVASLLGVDVNGETCNTDLSVWTSVVNGADCASYDNALAAQGQENADIAAGFTSPLIGTTTCNATTGNCTTWKFVGAVTSTDTSYGSHAPAGTETVCGFAPGVKGGNPLWFKTASGSVVGVEGASGGFNGYNASTYAAIGCAFTAADVGTGGSYSVLPSTYDGQPIVGVSGSSTSTSWTPAPVTKVGSDPDRNFTCVVHGDDGNDYSATSATFKESDPTFPAPQCPALPDGVNPSTVTISEDGGGQHNVLSSQPVTDEYQKQTTEFPGCDQGACELLLQQKQPDGTFKDCTDLGTACEPWFTDASKADDYECTYGGAVVELDECNVYSGIFDPARVAAGAPYSDPITGQWSGGQNGPDESQQAYGTQVQDPTAPRTCDNTTASGFDPIAWVMKPVQCALEWAFVPQPEEVHVDMTSASQAWQNTLPAEAITMVSSWSPTAGNTGCSIPVSFTLPPILGGSTIGFDAVNACSGPMANIATISRLATSAAIIVAAAFAVRRAFARSVGYGADGND